MTKKELRKTLINKRKTLNNVSEELVNDLIKSELLDNQSVIGLYYPLQHEIDVLALLTKYNSVFCFPKVVNNEIKFYKIKSLKDFELGTFNVLEPNTKVEVLRDEIGAFIIPCVGITKDGKRIGYGKGYYDRYLEGYQGLKIALNYKECSNIEFNAEDHDIKIDYIFVR